MSDPDQALPDRPLDRFRSHHELDLYFSGKPPEVRRYGKEVTTIFEREHALMAAAVHWPHAIVSTGLRAEMFEVNDYRFGFQCIRNLVDSGTIEVGASLHGPTMVAELHRAYTRTDGYFDDLRADLWLDQLVAAGSVNLTYAMRTLVPAQVARHNVKSWHNQAETLVKETSTEWRVRDLQQNWLTFMNEAVAAPDGGEIGHKMSDLVREWDPRDTSNKHLIPTGFTKIDLASGGGHGRGELLVIGGITSGGKSYMVQRLMMNQAKNQSPTLVVSCEDDKELIVARSLADFAKYPPVNIRTRHKEVDPIVIDRVKEEVATAYGDFVYYIDAPKCPVGRVCAMIRRHKYLFNINMVIVDYLQAIEEDEPSNQRVNDVANIIHKLTKCAKENQIALVLMSQYSREEYKNGAEPGLTACKFAGEIENECQILLLTWTSEEGARHCKIGKLKWAKAAGMRFIIPVDEETGCISNDWKADFAQTQQDRRGARDQRSNGNGRPHTGPAGGYGPNGGNGV